MIVIMIRHVIRIAITWPPIYYTYKLGSHSVIKESDTSNGPGLLAYEYHLHLGMKYVFQHQHLHFVVSLKRLNQANIIQNRLFYCGFL